MPDYLSPEFNIQISASAGFLSIESNPGSYDPATFMWTPGRGGDGRITQASFNLLPLDVWVKVAGTKIDTTLNAMITAQLPGYNDPGDSDPMSILRAYSGCAIDEASGRAFFHGGGHTDSAFNGILMVALNKFTWSIAKLPDHQANWAATYIARRDGSFTVYPPAKDHCAANASESAIFTDEFYDPGNPAASTHNPTSRHTYSALAFANGKLMHGVRRYWEWDEASGNWTRKYPFGQTYGTYNGNTGQMTEDVSGTWDEVANKYICGPGHPSSSGGKFWSYTPATQTFAWENWIPGSWAAYYAAIARVGRSWVQVTRPSYDGPDFWPLTAKVANLDTQTVTNVTLTGISKAKCIASTSFYESCAMTYIPPLGKLLYLMPYDLDDSYAASADIPLQPFLIDLAAQTITHAPQAGAWPPLSDLGAASQVENKLFYIPQLSALALVLRADREIIIKRVA